MFTDHKYVHSSYSIRITDLCQDYYNFPTLSNKIDQFFNFNYR